MQAANSNSWLQRNALVIILLFSYVLMSLLVLEQRRTITTQQTLIHQLFQDSVQLNALRVHIAQKH